MIREMYGELSAWGRFWLCLGLATLCAATAMSVAFGLSVSWKHALFLGCLSVIAAFAPDAAHEQWRKGAKGAAIAIAVITVPLLGIEFFSHAGYTGGLRGENVTTARIQNTKYDDTRGKVQDNKANLELWKGQLAKLQDQHAWSATVSADGLKAQLDSAQKEIDLEAARGGCKTKCLARMKEKAALEEKIAIAERASDLAKRIEATQRLVDTAREASANTEYKPSSVDFQNRFLSKNVALFAEGSLAPSEFMDAAADQTVNLAMAGAGTVLPAFALFVAGLYRIKDAEQHPAAPRQTRIKEEATAPAPRVSLAPLPVASSVPSIQPRIIERVVEKVQGPGVAFASRTCSLSHA